MSSEATSPAAHVVNPYNTGFRLPDGLIPEALLTKLKAASKSDIVCESYPYRQKLGRAEYEKEKRRLQIELLKAQHHIRERGQKVLLLFEGRD
ncbi:MAG: polyphosphate kinase 2, partial [Planctomycetota bacterium]